MMDDDDEFLYGGSQPPPPLVSVDVSTTETTIGQIDTDPEETVDIGEEDVTESQRDGEESDEDIEIILEPSPRSLDFRQGLPPRPPANRTSSSSFSGPPPKAGPSLTTEYIPHERGGLAAAAPKTVPLPQSQPQAASISAPASTPIQQSQDGGSVVADEGPDPSTLPLVTAPSSHPQINPTVTGTYDGRSIFEVDMAALAEKPWRRPGSDISDWFNYGFDEISWEAYCYRRRDLGDLGAVLKTNVLNFAGMPEDQLAALPPEVRQMVMTGATTMMSNAGANAMMNPAAVGMAPMMDMSGMGGMGAMTMGAMGMGMNGEMNMAMASGAGMMQDVSGGVVPGGPNAASEQQGVQVPMGMQDGFGMGMGGMGNEYGMQQEQGQMGSMGPGMYPGMEGNVAPTPPAGRAAPSAPYRGRAMAPLGMRARGGYSGRGRGRGIYGDVGPPPLPVRPASPLPPGVPTGPRNQNKYKDRDGNAPAVDGLDYGGTNKDGGRMESGEPEERGRKRRNSPGMEESRSKRR